MPSFFIKRSFATQAKSAPDLPLLGFFIVTNKEGVPYMPSRTRQLAENSLILGISTVLLFLVVNTVIGQLLIFALPVPFIMLAIQRKAKDMIFILAAFTFLGFIIASLLPGAVMALVFGLIGTVMGLLYKNRTTALPAIVGGAGMWFLLLVTLLAIVKFALGIDLIGLMKRAGEFITSDRMIAFIPTSLTKEQLKQQIDLLVNYFITVLPALIVMSSFMYSAIIHWLARIIGKRLGRNIPALKPLHEWSFPRTLLLYYFVCLLIILIAGDSLITTGWGTAVLNVNEILKYLFLIQGLSFVVFLLVIKGWKKFTPLLIIALFIFSPLANILSLLGIIDLGMGLRHKFETRK